MSASRVFVIAEAGVNHNGSLDMARGLIDAAAVAGADAVKFQTFRSELEVSRHARKAQYQVANTGSDESQLEMLRRLELSGSDHRALIEHARQRGIAFLSAPFDLESVRLLTTELDLPRIKIPSGEVTNLPLLLAVARSGRSMIMSTGMATLDEIELALATLAFGVSAAPDARPATADLRGCRRGSRQIELLQSRVVLLHCTTEYPAPFADVNLKAMDTMAEVFGLPVGYSDHTMGITTSIAAVARGATVIEKHITLDRTLPGPDHVASIEPEQLVSMVRMIREVEEALGDGRKQPMPSELKNIGVARKSLVAAVPVARGELFSEHNLTTKRPGSGVSAARYYEYLGRAAGRDYDADELIEKE